MTQLTKDQITQALLFALGLIRETWCSHPHLRQARNHWENVATLFDVHPQQRTQFIQKALDQPLFCNYCEPIKNAIAVLNEVNGSN